MEELLSRINKRFEFTKKELLHLFITSIVAAFAVTISPGYGFFDVTKGKGVFDYLVNFAVIFFLIFISLMAHFAIQKIAALHFGYTAEYRFWQNGLMISLIVCFLSWGFIPLFFTGALWMMPVSKLRVGTWRGGAMVKQIAMVAFAGPLVSLLLVGVLAPLYISTKSNFLYAAIVINLLIAIYSLLPIPTFEKFRQFKGGTTGLYIYIWSRWGYWLSFALVLFFSLLIMLFQVFSYILAIIVGCVVALIYYRNYEAI